MELESRSSVGPTRAPAPLRAASCDYCGSSAADAISGVLRDEEGQESLPVAFRDQTFQLVKCRECGLVYLPLRPPPSDLDVYYGADYKCFASYTERGSIMRALAAAVARRKLSEIQKYMPAGQRSLLDYGCGSGTWLNELREAGCDYRLIGTDVVPGALEALRARGIEAHCCDDTNVSAVIAPDSIGVIHNFHVIEHVPSPLAMLRALHALLVPGGVLLGQTPNVASFGRKVWGDAWNQWHVPRHFVLFDHETLRRHAQAAGFEVVSIRSSISGATQWAQSGLARWAKLRDRPFRGIHEPLYPPLILGCIPIALVESLLGHTCHMDFVLRKPG